MTKKIIKACDICGAEHEYVYKEEKPIHPWLLPGWFNRGEHFSTIGFWVKNGMDKDITNLGECCPECTECIKNAFHQKVALLRLRKKDK